MLLGLTACSCLQTIRSPTAANVKRLLSRLISKYQHLDGADQDGADEHDAHGNEEENPNFHGGDRVVAWPPAQ